MGRILLRAALLAAALLAGCDRKPSYPETLGAQTDAQLRALPGCVDVFPLEQPDGSYKALVFKLPKASESDSDWRVIFYKKDKTGHARHGAEFNLVNFERPRLGAAGEPPIVLRERRLGVRFHFEITPQAVHMVPSEKNEDGSLRGHPPAP